MIYFVSSVTTATTITELAFFVLIFVASLQSFAKWSLLLQLKNLSIGLSSAFLNCRWSKRFLIRCSYNLKIFPNFKYSFQELAIINFCFLIQGQIICHCSYSFSVRLSSSHKWFFDWSFFKIYNFQSLKEFGIWRYGRKFKKFINLSFELTKHLEIVAFSSYESTQTFTF